MNTTGHVVIVLFLLRPIAVASHRQFAGRTIVTKEETFGIGFGQIDVYLYPEDNALGIASWVFGSPRFGAARPDQMSAESRAVFQGVKSVHFILVQDAGDYDRHNYFRRHPGVLSDIAITMRTGARPADAERPLKHLDLNFWSIDKTYTPSYFGSLNSPDGCRLIDAPQIAP